MAAFLIPLMGYSASVPWIRAESNIDFVNNWTKIIRQPHVQVGCRPSPGSRRSVAGSDLQPARRLYLPGRADLAVRREDKRRQYVASFLLDQPSQTGRDLNTFFPAYRQWWFFAYAGDKWQATPKLTLDLGVRWEFYPPATPKNRRRVLQL